MSPVGWLAKHRETMLVILVLAAAISFITGSGVSTGFIGKDSTNTTGSSPLFGTLDTELGSINANKQAGVSVAMFELDWASFEPQRGKFDNLYMSSMKYFLKDSVRPE